MQETICEQQNACKLKQKKSEASSKPARGKSSLRTEETADIERKHSQLMNIYEAIDKYS